MPAAEHLQSSEVILEWQISYEYGTLWKKLITSMFSGTFA
jgi:hypothetical protein